MQASCRYCTALVTHLSMQTNVMPDFVDFVFRICASYKKIHSLHGVTTCIWPRIKRESAKESDDV